MSLTLSLASSFPATSPNPTSTSFTVSHCMVDSLSTGSLYPETAPLFIILEILQTDRIIIQRTSAILRADISALFLAPSSTLMPITSMLSLKSSLLGFSVANLVPSSSSPSRMGLSLK